MSSSSPKPSPSPPDQRLHRENEASESKDLSDRRVDRAQDERGTLDSLAGQAANGSKTSAPIMGYPMDENLFYSAPTQPADTATTIEELDYEEPAPEELLHPPDFRSFFTMIEDPETGEHQHPTVHYLFSDDDTEILTSAALDTLDHEQEHLPSQQAHDTSERCVIVDIAADGKTVTSASSLSADWQSLKATITQAPSWGEENNNADRGLLLKISGRHSVNVGSSKDSKRRQELSGNIDELVRIYGERLEKLDEVIGRS